jgi:hypothetical protein
METSIYAAWCGTGKTWVCKNPDINAVEVEYWKFKDGVGYVDEIKKYFNKVDYIFVSTDPEGIKLLLNEAFEIILVYPENELRNEYLDRYIERDSPYDFIGTFMKHWHIWIDELKTQIYCEHIVLKSGQYLSDVIKWNRTK